MKRVAGAYANGLRFWQRVRHPRTRTRKLAIAFWVVLFCTAPTPGDIGGCGQRPAELDPASFFFSKAGIDCSRCDECGLTSASCNNACMFPDSYPKVFPDRCAPLVHDGEVCLRALLNASCHDYAGYMADHAPTAPTECNFCPEPEP